MEKQPVLSIVTAVFRLVDGKRENVFRQMAESVRELSLMRSVEVIVKDGASVDGTSELCGKYLPEAKFLSSPDKGIYDAMNIGAEQASGKYLLFLNSDDYLHDPASLAALLDKLESENIPSAYSDVRRIKRDGSVEIRKAKMRSIFARMPYCHQTLVVRRDVFRTLCGYDTAFRIVSDHDFALRLYFSGEKALYWKIPYATFRSGGVCADKAKNHAERSAVFRKNYGDFHKENASGWDRIASNAAFPADLFLELLKRTSKEDRAGMILWFLSYRIRLLFTKKTSARRP